MTWYLLLSPNRLQGLKPLQGFRVPLFGHGYNLVCTILAGCACIDLVCRQAQPAKIKPTRHSLVETVER
ncbi:MAG: hypothetical protein LBD53_08335 [Tannerella sp.]|nr:hypothetical protein [Tannerella sp.]